MQRETEDDASSRIWRISVLRSRNLHQLVQRRGGNLNGWRPLVTLSVDPHLGHNHCAVQETTLGTDGQNPNSKTGMDIHDPHYNTQLLFEVVHFPQAAKKKARRLNRTTLGSCVYEMGELVRLANEQTNSSKQIITISLSPSGSGPRARHKKRLRKDGTTAANSDKGSQILNSAGPSLHIRLIPPKGAPLTLAGGSSTFRPALSLSSCEESEDEETESLVPSLDSSKTLNDENISSTDLPFEPKPSPESGIRRRRRRVRKRVYTGYVCDSGEEVEEEENWVSESASGSASDADAEAEAERHLEEIDEDDNVPSDPNMSSEWSPWPWTDHVAPIFGILGMAQPNPGILPSYQNRFEDNQKHQSSITIDTPMDDDTGPNIEEEPSSLEWGWEWWERVLCLFTVYRELRIAEYKETHLANASSIELGLSQSPMTSSPSSSTFSAFNNAEGNLFSIKFGMYDKIYQRLQVEWTYVGGLLIGLAAIDAAIFAVSPSSSSPSFSQIASGADAGDVSSSSSLFPIDSRAREAVSLSTISTALGLLCDAYFLMNYAWIDVGTFVNRARPPLPSSRSSTSSSQSSQTEQSTTTASNSSPSSQSWGYFALSSRIPAICMVVSIIFIGIFLLIVASEAAPPAGLWLLGVLVGIGMWMQYVVRLGKIVGRGIRSVSKGVTSGAIWVGNSPRWIWSRMRALSVRSDGCDRVAAAAAKDVPAGDVDTGRGKRTVIPPLPAKIRPGGGNRRSR